MSRRVTLRRTREATAASIAGGAVAIGLIAGSTLLLYPGRQILGDVGLLLGLGLASLAAGL